MANTVPNQTLNANQIAGYAKGAGFAGQDLVTAVAIALAESSGVTWAIDNDSNGSQDQGLWQINTVHLSQFPAMTKDPNSAPGSGIATAGTSGMFDPAQNAAAAYVVSSGGSNWGPWSTYSSGAYRGFLNAATTGAASPSTSPDTASSQSATAAAVAAAGNSGPAANPGLGFYLVDDHDAPVQKLPNKGDILKSVKVSSQIGELIVAGVNANVDISAYVTSGSVELDADQIGQLTFTVVDQYGNFGLDLTRFTRQTPVPVTYAGMKFQLSTVETQTTDGPFPVYQCTAQVAVANAMSCVVNPPTMPSGVAPSSGEDTLSDTAGSADDDETVTDPDSDGSDEVIDSQDTDPNSEQGLLPNQAVSSNPLGGAGGIAGTAITPTDYINYWVQQCGGTLVYGQQTYTQPVISPTPVQQGLPQNIYGETLYSVISRLASNYGYWFFDSDGTNCYFGAPGPGGIAISDTPGQGIISRTTQFKVSWGGAWGDPKYDCIGYPDCEMTTADILQPATIVVQLPRARGESVRPGMAMWLKGVTGFDSNGAGQAYIVTKVTWNLDSGQTPVSVTAITPVSPYPQDQSLLPQPAQSSGAIGSPGTSNNGAVDLGTVLLNKSDLTTDPTTQHSVYDFLTYAESVIGTPYVWGGHSPGGFDCSGLVEWACSKVGITFPTGGYSGSLSQEMYEECQAKGTTMSVSVAAFTPGALLFLGSEGSTHVAISLGDGHTVVQAPQVGQNVSAYSFGNSGALISYFSLAAQIPGVDYQAALVLPTNPKSLALPYG